MVGLTVERGLGTITFIWAATAATMSICFDLWCSCVQCLTHLVLQTAFCTNDVALLPALSNSKQKGGSGRGVVKLLH